jgi:hypothetical protein
MVINKIEGLKERTCGLITQCFVNARYLRKRATALVAQQRLGLKSA